MRTALWMSLLTLGLPVQAQEPHFGCGFNLIAPTGPFREYAYRSFKDSYDLGWGGQLTLSFPVQRNLAIRLNLSGAETRGDSQRLAGTTETTNLKHSQFNIGPEFQLFFDSAYRHKGPYFIGGVSADFERYDESFGDPGYDVTYTKRQSRLGATFGFGHSFSYDTSGIRWTLELSHHWTLSNNDVQVNTGSTTGNQDVNRPSTNYLKLSFGWIF